MLRRWTCTSELAAHEQCGNGRDFESAGQDPRQDEIVLELLVHLDRRHDNERSCKGLRQGDESGHDRRERGTDIRDRFEEGRHGRQHCGVGHTQKRKNHEGERREDGPNERLSDFLVG